MNSVRTNRRTRWWIGGAMLACAAAGAIGMNAAHEPSVLYAMLDFQPTGPILTLPTETFHGWDAVGKELGLPGDAAVKGGHVIYLNALAQFGWRVDHYAFSNDFANRQDGLALNGRVERFLLVHDN